MKDFSSSILLSLEALFLQFNYRRLFFWLFIIIFSISVFLSIEKTTGYFFFLKMERKITLLTKLNDLSDSGINAKPDLVPIFDKLVSELNSYKVGNSYPINITISSDSMVLAGKFIAGSLIGFVLSMLELIKIWQHRDEGRTFVATTFVLGVLLGFIGSLIPVIYFPWINIVAYITIQFILIIIIQRLIDSKKTVQRNEEIESDG